MLTIEEQKRLEAIALLLSHPTEQTQTAERNRDEFGRFAPETEESEYELREIEVKKVPGTYGTYRVIDRITWKDRLYLVILLGIPIFLLKML